MKVKITKKIFYKKLLELDRDIRHGLMCNKVCFDPFGECDCYEYNIHDEDIDWINKRIKKFKTYKSAVKSLLKKFDKPLK